MATASRLDRTMGSAMCIMTRVSSFHRAFHVPAGAGAREDSPIVPSSPSASLVSSGVYLLAVHHVFRPAGGEVAMADLTLITFYPNIG
jgi:hypothetical protein